MHDFYHDDPVDIAPSKNRNPLAKFFLALTLIGGGLFLQTTLAANVSLSPSGSVEFGQGVLQTVSCSGSDYTLTLTPYSSFKNVSGSGNYYFESMTVSNIPANCQGVDFTINAYTETGTSSLALFNSTSRNAVIWNNGGTFEGAAGTTGMSVASSPGSFSIRFVNPVALSSNVSRLTIQTTSHSSAAVSNVSYSVGDIGPGGGKIIYVSIAGFAETGTACNLDCHYLEVAPNGWNGGGDPSRTWAQSTPVDYTSTTLLLPVAFGYGHSNTMAIINQGNSNPATSAAALAASYSVTINGIVIDDWFLPSEGEQVYIVNNRTALGLNTGGGSWNSSSLAQVNGRYYNYVSIFYAGALKTTSYTVRPIRAF